MFGNVPLALASSPNAFPTFRAKSMSNDEPRPVDDGKQLDGAPLKTAFDWVIAQTITDPMASHIECREYH